MQQLLMQTEFFEPVFRRDAIISDSLNHAPLLMGRLCKAARYRYANCGRFRATIDQSKRSGQSF
jgi:7-keto-8-aminopelargonate synthetase-like enzyme